MSEIIHMKVAAIFSLLVIFFHFNKIYGQVFECKIIRIKNFGVVEIPVILDSIGQNAIKKEIGDNISELVNLNEATLKKEKTGLKKLILTAFDTTSTVFYPIKTINTFLKLNYNKVLTQDSIELKYLNDFKLTPNIILKRAKSKISSEQMRNSVFNDKTKLNSFLGSMLDFFKKNITDISGSYMKMDTAYHSHFIFQEKYPVLKFSYQYTITNDEKTQYIKNAYMLYKYDYIYAISFEYLKSEELSWKKYETKCLSTLKLY